MPPVPGIGESAPLFATKRSVEGTEIKSNPNPSANIFATALKGVTSDQKTNIFSNPLAATAPQDTKPDLFKSIEPPKNLFAVPVVSENSPKLTFSVPKSAEASSNIFTKSTEVKSVFKVPTSEPKFSSLGPQKSSENLFKTSGSEGAINVFQIPKHPAQAPSGTGLFQLSPPASTSNKSSFKIKDDARESLFRTTGSESSGLFKTSDAKTPLFNPPTSSAPASSSNLFKSAQSLFQPASKNVFAKPAESGASNLFKPLTERNVQNLPVSDKMKMRIGIKRTNEEVKSESEEGSISDEKQISPKFQRLKSREELKAIKSIICEQIPQQALNKKVLEKHFSKFGKITKIYVNLKKATATIHFDDHKSAKKAKDKGHVINAQIPAIGAIFYRKAQKTGLPDASPDGAEETSFPAPNQRPKIKSEDQRNLLQMVKSQGTSDFAKHDILDARDKLLRQKGRQNAPGTVLKGHCPDICPEKERYSRAIKNQLRVYEKLYGEVNHKATVKEYSRSSADQEVPLLHDLRPSNVLQVAMNHLLCNVIDRIEMNLGSMEAWYEHIMAGGSYPEPLNQR